MVNEPEMLLLTTCVLCSGILLSVCVFEIAWGFCGPTHCCSGPTNGRRATLPNTNPSWDGFFPAHPLMLVSSILRSGPLWSSNLAHLYIDILRHLGRRSNSGQPKSNQQNRLPKKRPAKP